MLELVDNYFKYSYDNISLYYFTFHENWTTDRICVSVLFLGMYYIKESYYSDALNLNEHILILIFLYAM